MPYSPDNPPSKLKELPANKQRQWVEVFNSCWDKHKDDAKCHAMAWGVVKKSACCEGQTIGPTENEGSLADAVRNLDILSANELMLVSRTLGSRHAGELIRIASRLYSSK